MQRQSEIQKRKLKIQRDVCVTKALALFFGLFIVITLAGFPSSAFAHRLSVFAWVEGDTVFVQGKLGGGKRPKQGAVYVYDGKEKLLFQTEINADGIASFPLPEWQTGLKVVVDIGKGHRSYWILTPGDIKKQRTEDTK
ncbi:MAG: hypothetical protein PVF94_14330 [Desulfobacterales bacterium]|jgi:nickel transport protein